MATFPPHLQNAKRDHPLIMIGVVMAILLAVLLALPFVTRSRNESRRRTISTTTPRAAAPTIPTTPGAARHF